MATPAPGTPQTGTKSWIALIGSLLTAGIPLLLQVSSSLPPQYQAIISGVLALLTMTGVYKVANKPKV